MLETIDSKSGGPVQGMLVSATAQLARAIPEVVTLDPPDAPFIKAFPFKVHAFGEPHWINSLAPAYGYTKSLLPWLKANLNQYDAVVVHGIWCYHALAAWQALAGTSIPYVVYTHGMMDPWFKQAYPLKHLKKQAYWSAFLGKILRDAQMVLFTAEDERILARGVFSGYSKYNERVVKFGITPPPGNVQEQVAAFRTLMPDLNNRKFLLFLGRIDPKKGCDLLVESFCKVKPADIDLVMAGPDRIGWQPELEMIATKYGMSDRIHWPGMVSGDAKWGAFRQAEAFVLSSHQENFGIAVAEALACRTPVLISNKINIWREIESGGGGLVADDTLPATEDLLRRFITMDPDQHRKMREDAETVFAENFDITHWADELIDIIEDELLPAMMVRKPT